MGTAGACGGSAAQRDGADAAPIAGESPTLRVAGRYEPLAIDRVDRLAREDGAVVVKGSTGSVPIDVPPEIDLSQPNPSWRLVTETAAGDTRRLTFTHGTTLDEFSIALPASTAELHYGAFLSTGGGSVLVFAWGGDSRCYWGYVTITRSA